MIVYPFECFAPNTSFPLFFCFLSSIAFQLSLLFLLTGGNGTE